MIVFAPNVGGGGGLVLLRAVLKTLGSTHQGQPGFVAILDARGREDIGMDWLVDARSHSSLRWVEPTLSGRWHAEWLLRQLARDDDIVLCFHNLPPILPIMGRVVCFVQNAHLLDLIPADGVSVRVRLRSAAERTIARLFRHRIHRYIVQTPTMAKALLSGLGTSAAPMDVLPFVADEQSCGPQLRAPPATDFLYVSDGSAHKNHRRLFAAWILLAEQGLFPKLAVTLHPHRDAALRAELDRLTRQHQLRIDDLGQRPHAEILAQYRTARALIFPSYAESFGLPLVEAAAAGLPILASELDYVRDVCVPVQSFIPCHRAQLRGRCAAFSISRRTSSRRWALTPL